MCAQLLSWFHLINRKLGGKPRMYAIGPDWDSIFSFVSGKLSKLQDRIFSCKNLESWQLVNLWSERLVGWQCFTSARCLSCSCLSQPSVKCFEFFSRPKFRLITYLNKQILDPCSCQACEAMELNMEVMFSFPGLLPLSVWGVLWSCVLLWWPHTQVMV